MPGNGKEILPETIATFNFPLRIAAKLPRKTPEELKLSRQDLLIELIVSELRGAIYRLRARLNPFHDEHPFERRWCSIMPCGWFQNPSCPILWPCEETAAQPHETITPSRS
ncbi:hypothetical protein CEXT_335921 [Caerostris extrusa]|uniref:Uncharacterized protein n=1 Tax=Caerostris extrusa TaxID=172846 RepID=A0AAV4TZR8_CAEEX|nr:hypothetical protein CEXT_335921 [Caerostris extrusa]